MALRVAEAGMSESKRRACDTCGGMGADPQTSPFHHSDCSFVRDGYECDCAGCPACNGRGWQSDQMPASDALADAETLRLYSDPTARNRDAAGRVEVNLGVSRWYSRTCRYFINVAILAPNVRYGNDDATATRAFLAYANATKSARAAFRAVPGLRGER